MVIEEFNMRFHLWFKVLCIATGLIASCAVLPTAAQTPSSSESKKQISQSQAVKLARSRVEGRVLRVDKSSNSYKVKMLSKSGRVVFVNVNRTTGKVQ